MYRSGAWRLSPARAYRALLLRLESALTADTARAREALRQVLGDARLVAEGDMVYAEMETRADRLLLDAMGAGVSNSGCGGWLWELYDALDSAPMNARRLERRTRAKWRLRTGPNYPGRP
jgi:hypothetical protein